jgi:capsular exopolysaccharide synthesis family protein
MLADLYEKRNKPGLTELLAGDVGFEETVSKIESGDEYAVDFIPTGTRPPDPSVLFESKKMDNLFKDLESRYDYIIYDSAPILVISDVLGLVKKMDGILFVLASAGTREPSAIHAKDVIENAGGRILGVVLNKFVPERSGYYSYYGYHYYDYYKYDKDTR